MSDSKPRLNRQHITVIFVLFLCLAAGVGLITNIGGLFLTPMAEDLGTGRGEVSNTMSICNVIYAFSGIMLSRIISVKNFKKLTVGAVVLTIVSTFLLSFSSALWQLYVLNALRGLATGLITTVLANIVINNWFFANTASIISVVMCASGLAGAAFSPIFGVLIGRFGWRTSFQIVAILMVVMFLPFVFAPVNLTPESVGAVPYGTRAVPTSEKSAVSQGGTPASDKPTSVSWGVRLMLMAFAGLGGLGVSTIQHFPGLAEANGLAVGSLMLSAAMITNTGGKLIIGFLIDRFGVTKSIVAVGVMVTLGYGLLFIPSTATYVGGSVLVGLGYAISIVGTSMMTRTMVGQARYAKIYPINAMCTTIFYAIGTSGIGYAYDFFGSYVPVLILMFAVEAIIMVITVLGTRNAKI